MENLIAQIAQTSRLQTLALNRLKALLTEVVGNAERSAVLFGGALQAHQKECSFSEECATIMTDAVGIVTAPNGSLSAGLQLKEIQGSFGEILKASREHTLAAAGKFSNTMLMLDKLAENVQTLGELSVRVLAELESSGQIAEKTNALAHKAIQEAQKAGFAGQGFSVIAGEVNKLAVKNKETAANIIPVAANLRNEIAVCLEYLSSCLEAAAATERSLTDNTERISRLTEGIERLFKILDQFNDAGRGVTLFADESIKALQDYAGIAQNYMAALHQLQKMTNRLKSALAQAAGYASFLTETDIGIGLFIDENLPSATNAANGDATAYHLVLPGPVQSFDPLFADDSASAEVCRLIYGRLVDIDSAG
ncbi:MAG TPA: hypothetical protein DDX03_10305, partial [Firmicutes bacterium]|nr:hypothetical protein [Bacillota bacterium]